MGWAYGIIDGREIGYGVEATCDQDGCKAKINRGLDYRCGGPDFDAGCGYHFCYDHLLISTEGQRCPPCVEAGPFDRISGGGGA